MALEEAAMDAQKRQVEQYAFDNNPNMLWNKIIEVC
jgi:hypothetical protein